MRHRIRTALRAIVEGVVVALCFNTFLYPGQPLVAIAIGAFTGLAHLAVGVLFCYLYADSPSANEAT